MTEYRKFVQNVIQLPNSNNEGYSNRTARNTNKLSRSKDIKQRLQHAKSKQMFLTDTQTSDYTKSSNQCGPSLSTESLNQTIRHLRKQNYDLKQQIVEMKSNSYFNINQDKLKELISQNQNLKKELNIIKKKLDDSIIQTNFLERFNKNLKTQCEQITSQNVKLTKQSTSKVADQKSPRNTYKLADADDNSRKAERYSVRHLQDMYKSRKSHKSRQIQEKLAYRPIQSSKSKQTQNQRIIKKSRSTSRVYQNEYFAGKGVRQQPKKQKRNKKLTDE